MTQNQLKFFDYEFYFNVKTDLHLDTLKDAIVGKILRPSFHAEIRSQNENIFIEKSKISYKKLTISYIDVSVSLLEEFNDIVITHRNGIPIYIKDIGVASDASAIQTNIVRIDGKEQVYLPIFKRQGANTIAAVEAVKKALPQLKDRMPEDVNLNVIFDQSSYVKSAISSLIFS